MIQPSPLPNHQPPNRSIVSFIIPNQGWRFDYHDKTGTSTNWSTVNETEEYGLTASFKNGIVINGTRVATASSEASTADFTVGGPLLIFASNNAYGETTPTENYASMTLSSAALYDRGGVCIMKLIPCKDSSGTVGLWDSYNNRFLTPSNGSLTIPLN